MISTWGDEEFSVASNGAIDFRKAKKLKTTGSTCDAYDTRYHGRRVFVKRLKAKFRTSDRYREAFRKEYEIGVSLSHPGLPVYTDFYGDYLVMNFIDGKTLADLLTAGDPRLKDKTFVFKLLNQLLDVIDYLHQHNVVHCDIKADNIMITAQTGNLVLIDLDKCYTSWLDTTPGSSALYGLPADASGSPDIDLHGTGLVSNQIASMVSDKKTKNILNKFSDTCKKRKGSVKDLRDILNSDIDSPKKKKESPFHFLKIWFLLMVGIVGLFSVVILIGDYLMGEDKTKVPQEVESVNIPVSRDEKTNEPEEDKTLETIITIPTVKAQHFPTVDEINLKLKTIFIPFYQKADSVEKILNDETISDRDKVEPMEDLYITHIQCAKQGYSFFEEKYPEQKPMDIQMAVVNADEYQKSVAEVNRLGAISLKIPNELDRQRQIKSGVQPDSI